MRISAIINAIFNLLNAFYLGLFNNYKYLNFYFNVILVRLINEVTIFEYLAINLL